MLKNLEKLVEETKTKVEKAKKIEKNLPTDFKKLYSEILAEKKPDGYSSVKWNANSAVIKTTTDKEIFLSSNWFYIASALVDYYTALMDYKEAFNNIFKGQHNLKSICEDLKTNSETKNKQYNELIDKYFVNSGNQKEFFLKFITDYKWWGGGKTIDRGDFFVSPLMNIGNLLAETQTGIAEITKHLASNDELRNMLIIENFEKSPKSESDSFIPEFFSSIQEAGYLFNFNKVASTIFSLIAKSFLIVTGNSGTGKTKLSQLFAQWLNKSGATLLPVGAGWTDSRPILGFYNSLQNIYQTTPALELILDASENSDLPFFLILDEMNLSHVERYFADFLSAMESGEYIPLHTHGSEVKSPSGRKIPEKIKMPPNLFVIGTVNIDETTYMFSPKVLDRANVIEFKVSSDEIAGFLESGESASREIESAEPGTAAAFLSLALRAQGLEQPALESLPAEYMAPVNRALKDVFEILQIRGFEFAYRAASEIIRFTQAAYELAETDEKGEKVFDVNHVIDTQILQKILPKIHGSRKKIEHLLAALAQYCINDSLEEALNQFKKCDVNTGLNLSEDAVIYKNSYKKLAEMIESVRRDQFVSFIQ